MSEITRSDWEHDMDVFKDAILTPLNQTFEADPPTEDWHQWIEQARNKFSSAKNNNTLNLKDSRSYDVVNNILDTLVMDFEMLPPVENWHQAEAYILHHFEMIKNVLALQT